MDVYILAKEPYVKLWYVGYRLYYLVWSLSTPAVLPGAKG